MNSCDVDIVVNRYLLCSFVLNGLLGGLCDDFGSVSMIVLSVYANNLAGDSSILIGFLSYAGLSVASSCQYVHCLGI